MAQDQALRLDNCCKLVRRAVAMRLDDDSRNSLRESLFDCFAKPLELGREQASSLDELLKVLEERSSPWRGLVEDVQRVRPPVFVSHAFLRLSDSTGVEVASLFIAVLMALGAINMAFYYATVAGQAANAYWTLEDLIIQGVLVLPWIVAALIVVEIVFAIVRQVFRGPGGYRWHGVILAHPLQMAVAFVLVMAVALSIEGHLTGTKVLEEFETTMNPDNIDNRQMATVMDLSVLNNVYLVGTTDRTAIFLQMKESATSVKVDPPSLEQAASCVATSFGIGKKTCVGGGGPNHLVLVMDRALVVCHARMGECEVVKRDEKGKPEAPPGRLAEQLTALAGNVTAIKRWSRDHDERLNAELRDVEKHMNRHLNIILAGMGAKSEDGTKSGSEDADKTD